MEKDSWAVAAAISAVAFSCAIFYTLHAWFTHRERMAKIAHGIDPDEPASPRPRQPPSDRVTELAKDPTRKIEAIVAYREETGVGLAEAKKAVESIIDNPRS